MGRSPKGSVKIEVDRGWLRLRWSFGGRRFALALGLQDEGVNRAIAQRKAAIIEADLRAEQFDPTLEKYKLTSQTGEGLTVVELFEKFTEYKAKQLDPDSLQKYRGLLWHLQEFFKRRDVGWLSEDRAIQFRDYLLKKLVPITVRERLTLLRGAWKWGQKRGLVKLNPWLDVMVKVPPKQKPRPFTKEEKRRILEGFKADPDYSYLADFVEFMLATGCRPGEAAGLKWKHLTQDCSGIWIGEAWVRGRQKPTKTNKDRSYDLTPRLRELLLGRRPQKFSPDDPVFWAKRGGRIDDHNFRNRAWKSVLARVGVEYRKPYNSRHTFVSHAHDQGLTLTEISDITGHSEETILRHYLGSVRGRATLPELD